ncbi:ESX secretion-associated protein EspG [Sciscionella marina]|uniref:ESX secretion-associated protein EspG n=1 Tax=Sciscionella marina TaxID=508770 RepID=UPI00038159BE|nr:ESX secretion-associated protein EspG [Sciscionella marina]
MPDSVVLSPLEFDVAWELEGHREPRPAIRVPSPGRYESERAELVRSALASLGARGLARRGRIDGDLADRLALLANYRLAVDTWVYAERWITALAVTNRHTAQLAVVDSDEVWLIPARENALVEAAVSVAGSAPQGAGSSVSVPEDLLVRVDAETGGDPEAMITKLERDGVRLNSAQTIAQMAGDISVRGQFGAERRAADGGLRRANRVVGFHDNPSGRFAQITGRAKDGTTWLTMTPADNEKLLMCVCELLDEL